MSGLLIERFGKTYRDIPAIDGVSLVAEPGRVLALAGPSGSGKSTLLKLAAGIETPDTGAVFVGGRDVSREPAARRRIAYASQTPSLWPHMSVRENVAFGPESLQWPEEETARWVAEVLSALGAASLASRRPATLSGGETRRVALARAIAMRPAVLLLDEPLSGLDAVSRRGLAAMIRTLCRDNGIAVVWATGELDEAYAVADELAVMVEGRIVAHGDPAELRRRPGTRLVAELLGEANFIPAKIIRAGAGEFLAETAFGEIRGALPSYDEELEEGAAITVMIRPECLRLDEYAPDENAFGGAVAETVFHGDRAMLRFATPAGSLRVLEINPRMARSPDDTLFAWVLPEDVIALPA